MVRVIRFTKRKTAFGPEELAVIVAAYDEATYHDSFGNFCRRLIFVDSCPQNLCEPPFRPYGVLARELKNPM